MIRRDRAAQRGVDLRVTARRPGRCARRGHPSPGRAPRAPRRAPACPRAPPRGGPTARLPIRPRPRVTWRDRGPPRGERLLPPPRHVDGSGDQRLGAPALPAPPHPGDGPADLAVHGTDPSQVLPRVGHGRAGEHQGRTDLRRVEVAQRPTAGRAADVRAVEVEVAVRGHHPDGDLAERGRRRLAEVAGGALRGTVLAARVAVGVQHEDGVARGVPVEERDQGAGQRRPVGAVREVGQVDADDQPDRAPRRPQAHGDGAVPRPEPEPVRHEREDLPGLAHPERGGLHGVSPPDRRTGRGGAPAVLCTTPPRAGHVGGSTPCAGRLA